MSYGASLEASWTYDNEGKMVSVTYPNGGKTHTYTFDSMGRPQKETDNAATPVDWAKGAQYGPAGELTLLQYTSDGTNNSYYTENRVYNSRLQLHEMWVTGVVNLTYNYAAGQNNGRIYQRKDWVSGDRPLRPRADNAWDGVASPPEAGNLTAMPLLSGMTYDVENRLTQVTHSFNGTDQYRYDPANRRVWKKKPNGTEETYFYGVDPDKARASGKKLGTYSGTSSFTTVHQNVYFAGKLIWAEGSVAVNDRLGSVSSGGRRYFPYGEERTTTTQDRTKFATYFRDATTALDYADQRYYGRTIGRFLTPDPGPPVLANPQSWNRYSYAWNEPVNVNDPSGRFIEVPGPGETYCDIYPDSPQCAVFWA